MLPFNVSLKSGAPIYEQVVHAIKRAIARGELKAGDPLPSVRELSRELQINPNTAQKVISTLSNEKLIEMRPGIGSVVAQKPPHSEERVTLLLEEQLEVLIIDAAALGVTEESFFQAVKRHWNQILRKEVK